MIDDYNEATFSWRKLFHKLCFEEMIDNFTKVCDFEKMYKYINVLGSEIPVLRLKVLEKKNLKLAKKEEAARLKEDYANRYKNFKQQIGLTVGLG